MIKILPGFLIERLVHTRVSLCDSAEETITVCTAQNNDFHFSTKPKSSPWHAPGSLRGQ